MKHASKLMIVALMAIYAAGCSKKGSSNASTPTTTSTTDTTLCTSNCDLTGGYINAGDYTGRLSLTSGNSQYFQRMMQELGICYGWDCNSMASFIDLKVRIREGYLPAFEQFKMRAFSAYGQPKAMRRYAQAETYMISNGKGFQMLYSQQPNFYGNGYNQNYSYGGFNFSYGYGNSNPYGQYQQSTAGQIKIVALFTNSAKTQMKVQVQYNGKLVAQGTIHPSMNTQPLPSQPYGGNNNPGYQEFY